MTNNSDASQRPVVIVTGAAGFIGTHLREKLSANYHLLSVDILPLPTEAFPNEDYACCDLGSAESIAELFDRFAPLFARAAGLFHLAGYYDFSNQPNERYARLLSSLPVLLRGFAERCPENAPFIFASSMAAMAPTEPGRPMLPTSPKFAGWEYPKFKVACEAILDATTIRQPIVQLVTAGVYSEWAELVPLFHLIEAISNSGLERTFYPANPDRGLTYLHVSDLARAYARAIRAFSGRRGHFRLLVGEPKPTTYRQIRNAVLSEKKFNLGWHPIIRLPKSVVKVGAGVLGAVARAKHDRRFIQPWMIQYAGEHFEFDIGATEEALGWKPSHYLGDELAAMMARAKDHAEEWLTRNRKRPW